MFRDLSVNPNLNGYVVMNRGTADDDNDDSDDADNGGVGSDNDDDNTVLQIFVMMTKSVIDFFYTLCLCILYMYTVLQLTFFFLFCSK